MTSLPDILRLPADWTIHAACVDHPQPDLWFDHFRFSAARAVCATCPVQTECLNYALHVEGTAGPHHRAGVFGGCSPAERWRLASTTRTTCTPPDDPAPPPAAPRLLRTQLYATCVVCGRRFPQQRRPSIHCSATCRNTDPENGWNAWHHHTPETAEGGA